MAELPLVPHDPHATAAPLMVRHCPLVPTGSVFTEFAPLPTSSDPAPQPAGMERPSAPLAVTGEPLVPKPEGSVRPTLVTVPVPQLFQTSAVPFEARH